MMAAKRLSQWLMLYLFVVLLLASANSCTTHAAPFTCTDNEGHGPDGDTVECMRAIALARQRRPSDTSDAFLRVLFWGAIGLSIYGAGRTLQRATR